MPMPLILTFHEPPPSVIINISTATADRSDHVLPSRPMSSPLSTVIAIKVTARFSKQRSAVTTTSSRPVEPVFPHSAHSLERKSKRQAAADSAQCGPGPLSTTHSEVPLSFIPDRAVGDDELSVCVEGNKDLRCWQRGLIGKCARWLTRVFPGIEHREPHRRAVTAPPTAAGIRPICHHAQGSLEPVRASTGSGTFA